MALRQEPPKRPPVDVIDVTDKPVPFLRPLEWVATALRTFRERPLPGSYTTEARPTFDLFGTAQFQNYQVEVIAGVVGALEVTGSQVATDKWRQYLSISVAHDDIVAREVQMIRVVQDPTLGFPQLTFAVSRIPLAAGPVFAVRNVSVPPDGRVGATVFALTAGSRLTLRTLFVDYAIGETYGFIS